MLRTVILLLAAASGSAFTPMRTAKLAAAPARSKVTDYTHRYHTRATCGSVVTATAAT